MKAAELPLAFPVDLPAAGRSALLPSAPRHGGGPGAGAGDHRGGLRLRGLALRPLPPRRQRLAAGRGSCLDPPLRHPLQPRPRRSVAVDGAAHRLSAGDLGPRLLARRGAPHPLLLRPSAADGERHPRRLSRPRPDPLLPLLGADADPDVLPDRHLGARPAHLRRGQVLPLHPRRQPADAGGDPGPLLRPRPAERRLHLRPRGAASRRASPARSPGGFSAPSSPPSRSRCRWCRCTPGSPTPTPRRPRPVR